jgi:hypothetical protein
MDANLVLLGQPLIWHAGRDRSHFTEFLHRALPAGKRAFVVSENMGSFDENTIKIVAAVEEMAKFAPITADDRLFVDRSAEVGLFQGERAERVEAACRRIGLAISQVAYVSENSQVALQVANSGAKWLFFHHYYVSMAREHAANDDMGYDRSGNKALVLNSKTRPHRIALLSALLGSTFADRIEYSWRSDPALYDHKQALAEAKVEFPSFSATIDAYGNLQSKVLQSSSTATRTETLVQESKSTFLEIVAETDYTHWVSRITEKSLKPIAAHRPFIVFGSSGVLRILRELGFKTFSSVWDESYDDIQDANLRLSVVMRSIGQAMSLDFEEVKARCRDICAYNQAHLRHGFISGLEGRFNADVAALWTDQPREADGIRAASGLRR